MNLKLKTIRMALILSNFYSEGFPSWPEVMGVYGIELPKKGYIVDWYMSYNASNFQKIKTIKFHSSTVYLIPRLKSNNYLFSLLSIFIYQLRLLFTIIRNKKVNRYNILQVRDDIFSGLTSLFLKTILNIPLTFNYSFPFYEGAYDFYMNNKISKFELLTIYIQDIFLKRIIFKNCDFIFPISKEMSDNLYNDGIQKEKMYPLTLGVEPEIFKITPHSHTIKSELGLNKDDFIFSYIGSLGILRGLDLILDALEIVLIKHPETKVLFVGSTESTNTLKSIINTKKLNKNIIFSGQVSYFEVPNYISISDVCLSIIRPLRCFYVASPCKIFEYMLIGKPIIANEEIPEHMRVITASNCGKLVKFNKLDLANAMLMFIENKINLHESGINGQNWVLKNRTFKLAADNLEKIYLNIIK